MGKQFGETLHKAMEQMEDSIKKVVKLPKEFDALSGNVTGAKDVAQIDVRNLRRSLDSAGSCEFLDGLHGLKEPLKEAADKIKHGCAEIEEFVMNAPDSIKAAFDLPQPLCFLQSMVVPQAPPVMMQLLEIVDKMSKLDMDAMHALMEKIHDVMSTLEPESVSNKVQTFRASTFSHMDKLDELVDGAKGSGGATSKTSGKTTPRSKMSSMRKMFGGA